MPCSLVKLTTVSDDHIASIFIVEELSFMNLTIISIQSYTFWDTMLHSLVKVNQCIKGTQRLHLQCRRLSFHKFNNMNDESYPLGYERQT
jgi:hypothetical protein